MTLAQYKRKHLRAPLRTFFIYEEGGYVFKSRLTNISEEGALIESLPYFPSINVIGAMIDVPLYPQLGQYSIQRLRNIDLSECEREIHRVRIRTLRRTEQLDNLQQILMKNIGGQLVAPSQLTRSSITKYVNIFASNLSYLLKLLQDPDGDEDRIEKIRLIAKIIGYDESSKISILHQKVKRDYQSLV